MMLGNDFIEIGQVSAGVYQTRNIILWVIFGVLIFVILMLLFFMRRQRRRYQNQIVTLLAESNTKGVVRAREDASPQTSSQTQEIDWRTRSVDVD